MKNYSRVFVALAVLFSGIALIPFISLSSETFSWQRYADVYRPAPAMVSVENFAFLPDTVLIPVGTTVRWTNQDGVAHTVTSNDALFDSGAFGQGESFEYRFDTPGTYPYFCSIHPAMKGTVIVVDQMYGIFLPIILR